MHYLISTFDPHPCATSKRVLPCKECYKYYIIFILLLFHFPFTDVLVGAILGKYQCRYLNQLEKKNTLVGNNEFELMLTF